MKFKLKVRRIEKGIKQKDLAQQLGITQQYLCNIEKGKVEPRRDLMKKISELLEISVTELFFNE